jgi:ESS family glutamate:Na+ symporter
VIATLKLDLIQTLAVAAVVFYVGVLLRKRVAALDRLNIPSAVVGGLLFALVVLVAHDRWFNFAFDTSAQPLFMVAFFTSIGMGASVGLLKRGGAAVVVFLLMSTLFCFVQNFVGMGIARWFGVNEFLGVIAGSVSLVGGPATGLAFAPLFEKAGVTGADTLAMTAAMFGIVCGGLTGGPVATWLIRRHGLAQQVRAANPNAALNDLPATETLVVELGREDSGLALNMIVLSTAMGIGSVLSWFFQSTGLTLPAYIGAMLIASLFRNIDDRLHQPRIDQRAMEFIGDVSLNVFLVVALMDLKLWQLLHLAGPLFTILAVQAVVVLLFSLTISFWAMGRDYDSAVMASGFIGFVLGTTANAMANMKTLAGKFGPSPRAFLVVPMVGAFFIDFTNALIIVFFLNWLA